MTEARKAAILEKLRGGDFIFRHWRGSNRSGYLAHSLSGINNLRESEVRELYRDGYIETIPKGEPNYRLRTAYQPYRLKQLATVFKEHGV